MPQITIDSLSFGYARNLPVLQGISLSVEKGETWAIIGKNGSGKSTLLKCIGNLVRPEIGSISLKGKPIKSYKAIELAKVVSYVPQASGRMLPPYSVWDFVMLGRFPYQGFLALPGAEDRRIVDGALELTDASSLACRAMGTLSGGELQRVFLAAAVAQETEILLLDEPMSFLDPLHQETIHRSLARIHDEFNSTILTVTHDVNLALNRFSHICALAQGKAFFIGTSREFRMKACDLLREIYSLTFSEIGNYDDSLKYYLPEAVR